MSPIPKKPGAKTEGEHRGASVAACVSKIVTRFIRDRIMKAAEMITGDYQYGARPKLGTDDCDPESHRQFKLRAPSLT